MRTPRSRQSSGLSVVTAQSRKLWRVNATASIIALTALCSSHADGAYKWQKPRQAPELSTLLGPRLTSTFDWWSSEVEAGKRFELRFDGALNETLRLFQVSSSRNHWRAGAFGSIELVAQARWVSNLYWHVDFNEIPDFEEKATYSVGLIADPLRDAIAFFGPSLQPYDPLSGSISVGVGTMLRAPKPADAPVAVSPACSASYVPQPIAFTGLAGESDRFAIVDCNDVVSADAMDRLSVIGRLPGSPRPTLPLPTSPKVNPSFENEWVEGVHLLHPRLVGFVEQIARAFPNRSIIAYSGYRRDRRQTSPHVRGRALDLAVRGVPNESLYNFCRTLPNSGCGYYPNQLFVHVDTRDESKGSAAWVDIALPGQPSVYTEIWPIRRDEAAMAEVE